MFSVPSISTLSNSIEAALAQQPTLRVRTDNLRRSDKSGLTNYLRHEHGIRGVTVSIGYRSVTVRFRDMSDADRVIGGVRGYAKDRKYVVSKSRRFSVERFVQALKR